MSSLLGRLPADEVVGTLLAGARRDDARGGVLDLTAAALLEPDPHHERARLVTRGFVEGCARWWEAPAGSVQVTLTRLRDRQQADLSVDDTIDTLEAAGATLDRRRDGGRMVISTHITDDTVDAFVATTAFDDVHVIVVVATHLGPAARGAGSETDAGQGSRPDGRVVTQGLIDAILHGRHHDRRSLRRP